MLDIQFNFEINYLFTAGLWNNNNNKKKRPVCAYGYRSWIIGAQTRRKPELHADFKISVGARPKPGPDFYVYLTQVWVWTNQVKILRARLSTICSGIYLGILFFDVW